MLRLLLGKHETAEAPGAYVLQHNHQLLLLPPTFFLHYNYFLLLFLFHVLVLTVILVYRVEAFDLY